MVGIALLSLPLDETVDLVFDGTSLKERVLKTVLLEPLLLSELEVFSDDLVDIH